MEGTCCNRSIDTTLQICRTNSPTGVGHEDDCDTVASSGQSASIHIRLSGMDCTGCTNEVDQVLLRTPGVLHHVANPVSGIVRVQFDGLATTQSLIVSTLRNNGYPCEVVLDTSQSGTAETLTRQTDCTRLRGEFICSLFYSIPLYVVSQGVPFITEFSFRGLFVMDVLALCLTMPLLYMTRRFYLSAANVAISGRTNFDSLVTCGVIAAMSFSILAVTESFLNDNKTRSETCFSTVGELITSTLLGRWLECKANAYTTTALSAMMKLQPRTVVRLEHGCETIVTADKLQVADLLLVRPGAQFGADCIVRKGRGTVDESSLNGNILPVPRSEGDMVYAGMLNLSDTLECEVQRVGAHTRLNQIVALLIDAHEQKARLQLLAERVAKRFVPVMLMLATLTFFVWLYLDPVRVIGESAIGHHRILFSLKLAIAVVVIACPCALSIATPAAVMVGMGAAARHGILIRGAPAVEKLSGITDIVFDKTRTLTQGVMCVTGVHFTRSSRTSEQVNVIWRVIHAAECLRHDIHPASLAIEEYAALQYPDSSGNVLHAYDPTAYPGMGFSCRIKSELCTAHSRKVLIGSRKLLEAHKIVLPSTTSPLTAEAPAAVDETNVYIAIDGQFVCIILLSDIVKLEASSAIAELSASGKTVWMLTGDRRAAAEAVARQVGIPLQQVFADCSAQDKARVISDLKRQGRVVAMVGDGVNDALALSTADVGISLAGSTEVALASAEVVLMKSNGLTDILTALLLASTVQHRIRLNLFFAAAWNAIMLPVAMGVFLPWHIYVPPGLAGLVMSLSCLSIIASSLSLTTWQKSTCGLQSHRYSLSSRFTGLTTRLWKVVPTSDLDLEK